MQRPFRFGVVAEHAQSRGEWVDKARKAEDMGFDTLLVPDHLGVDLAPIVALSIAAQATTTLKIGSFVFANDFRHPVILAKEVATLDLLSGGRFEFGLGAGYLATDYTQTGIQFDGPGTRISRFEEALQLIKKTFTEETVNFSGQYYTVSNLKGSPRPAQKPYPPIYIGGGAKRVLSIAAREATIVGFTPRNGPKGLDMGSATAEATAEKIAWVRDAAGSRFDELELSSPVFIVVMTEGREHVAEQMGGRFGMSARDVLSSSQILIGTVNQIVEELQMRRERFGISYIEVVEERMEMMAPVVARLAGK